MCRVSTTYAAAISTVSERYSVVMPFALLNSSVRRMPRVLNGIYCISNMHLDYIYLRSTVDGLASMFRCGDKYLWWNRAQPAFFVFVFLEHFECMHNSVPPMSICFDLRSNNNLGRCNCNKGALCSRMHARTGID